MAQQQRICLWCAATPLAGDDGLAGLICGECIPALRAELQARLGSDRALLRVLNENGRRRDPAPYPSIDPGAPQT